MNTWHCLVAVALVCTAVAEPLRAQSPAPAQPASAAAPPRGKPSPRLLTPAETRDSASTPGDLRPEDRVIPQISIPLGRTPPGPALAPKAAVRRDKAGKSGIDDAAARCGAQASSQARAACLEKGR
jgi:hypothetical protein